MSREQSARIVVRVQPKAGRNAIIRFQDGVLHVRIAAPPVKGQANRELLRFLSDVLKVPGSSLSIEKGATSRVKVIAVEGLTEGEVKEQMESSLV